MLTRRKPAGKKIFQETFKDFAENTSIHGLKYTVHKDFTFYEKAFWLIVVIMGILGAAYMTMLFWVRYTSNPTRTSILTTLASTTQFPFPAVTFCNINRIVDSKVEKFIGKLDLFGEDLDLILRAFKQLLAYTNPTWIEYNISELNILENVLEKNNIYDQYVLVREITQNCNEMFVKCLWDDIEVNCESIFKESHSPDGMCCSFNYNYKNTSNFLHNFYSEFSKGLTVVLDSMVEPVQNSIFNSVGVMTYIHRPVSYPGDADIKKAVCMGRQTLLGVSTFKIVCSESVRSLSIKQRECFYPNERHLQYFARYTDTNCEFECKAKRIFKQCNCVPYYYDFTDKPICPISKILCLQNVNQSNNNCNCLPECEDMYYDVLSTSTAFHKDNFVTFPFILNSTVSVDHIYLSIYFSKPTQTILKRDTITSTIYLLSSFGGVYSLFVGCSFVTAIELIYYLTLRIYVGRKMLKSKNKKKMQSNTDSGKDNKCKIDIGLIYGNNWFIN